MADLTQSRATAIAAEAFIFGYPLVLMAATWQQIVSGAGAPANQFDHKRTFPDASFTGVVSPNADTLYSSAALDLSAEPVVLGVPASGGRYYLMPVLSGWTDVFAAPGSRTTGDEEGAFAICGPTWRGELPEGVTRLRSPTSMAWLIGRTQTNGAADYEQVNRFQDRLSLTPLSEWKPGATPSRAGTPGGDHADSTPPPDQVEAMDGTSFFTRLAELMVDNPPAAADWPALERFAAIGLTVGSFDPEPDLVTAIAEGAKDGIARLKHAASHPAEPHTAWILHHGLGAYGTDYAKRAMVALFGLGANLDEDAVYPHTEVDGSGAPLDGANRYRLHFGAGETPPAKAFWSLTIYNDRHYFAENPIDRYAIGDRDPLRFNDDGSLDLWLQHETPGAERESNWLPAPAGAFSLILRIYWPSPEALAGKWLPPAIERMG